MTDSPFPLYPFESDPWRIFSSRNARPASPQAGDEEGASAPSSGPAGALGPPDDGSAPGAGDPAAPEACDPPHPSTGSGGEGDRPQGGGSLPSAATPESPLHHRSDGPPSPHRGGSQGRGCGASVSPRC